MPYLGILYCKFENVLSYFLNMFDLDAFRPQF